MRKLLMTAALAGALPALLSHHALASVCSVSDISLTIASTTYTPSSCADAVNNGNPTQETANLNSALGTNFSFLAKSDGTTSIFDGIQFSVTTSSGVSGSWTVSWVDTNGSSPLNLPVIMDFDVGLFGGSTGAGYLLQGVLLPASPNQGSGTFDITFTNNGGQNPTISHLTLTGGDPRPPTSVPEPGTLALLGTGLLGLGFSLRRRHH